MFEIDIDMASRQGIKLHDSRGDEYWKLQLICYNEGCDNVVDMGECLCFDTEKEMINCRDGHSLICSTKCFIDVASKETVDKILDEIKNHNKECQARGEFEYQIGGKDIVERIDNWFDYNADAYDGADFYEYYDIKECPI